MKQAERIHRSFESLSDDDRDWLHRVQVKLGCKPLLNRIQEGIAMNQKFLAELALNQCLTSEYDLTLAVARDWSDAYTVNRDMAFSPILRALSQNLTNSGDVLVLGAGMCRLAFEVASLGYRCTAVESDPSKRSAVKFISTLMHSGESRIIQPDVLDTCNRLTPDFDILSIPDVSFSANLVYLVSEIPKDSCYDAIITYRCFCSDSIKSNLSENGVWINLDRKEIAGASSKEIVDVHTSNPSSMMKTIDRLVLSVRRK